MAIQDEGIRALNQDEHNEDAHAKRTVLRYQDSSDGFWYNWTPTSGDKVTQKYAISAISLTDTYKYFFFEDASKNWYILRKTLATSIFDYAKGTGGYQSVYVDSTSGPSGSPTFDSYGDIF